MKTLPQELDVLFDRTLTALEVANKSTFKKGKKTDAKIQQFIATQQGFRTWHDFIKSIKESNNKKTFNESIEEMIEEIDNTSDEELQDKFYSSSQAIGRALRKTTNYKIYSYTIDPNKNPHKVFDLDVEKLSEKKQIVDIGYNTLDIHKDEELTSTVNMGKRSFIVPNSVIDKLEMEELFDLLSGCYSSRDVRAINEKLCTTNLSLNNTKRLLDSCETALEEEQQQNKTMRHWTKTNPAVTLVVQHLLDFLFDKQTKIKECINNNKSFNEELLSEIDEYFYNGTDVYYEEENASKLISGFSEKRLSNLDLENAYECSIKKINGMKFDEVQAHTYSYAFEMLTKDTLTMFEQLIEKQPKNIEWDYKSLSNLLKINIKELF